jgi:hypothetical protein
MRSASARSVMMPWALRSVMPRLAAMPGRRTTVICDAQHPGMVGQEGPVRYQHSYQIPEISC